MVSMVIVLSNLLDIRRVADCGVQICGGSKSD